MTQQAMEAIWAEPIRHEFVTRDVEATMVLRSAGTTWQAGLDAALEKKRRTIFLVRTMQTSASFDEARSAPSLGTR